MIDETKPHEPLPESRFIGPTDLCPLPGNWSSTDGDSTELEVSQLIYGLVRGLQPRGIVETGAAWGQTTNCILDALKLNRHGVLWAIENDQERADELAERLLPDPQLTVVSKPSLEVELPDEFWLGRLDFAFLDTWYELRVPEFLHFRRWMRKGTIVAIHDTRSGAGEHRIEGRISLRQQIERELVDTGQLRCIDLPTPRGLTLGEVL